MSNENVEQVARNIAEGISTRDVGALEANSDPDIEYTSRFTAVEGKTYGGRSAWSDYISDVDAAWKDFEVTAGEMIPARPEKRVAAIRVGAVARGSGVPIDERAFAAWEFRDGKALRGRTCANRAEALKAIGIEE